MTLDEALITPEGKEFLKAIGMSANEVKFYYSFYQQSKQKQVAVVVAETDGCGYSLFTTSNVSVFAKKSFRISQSLFRKSITG